MLLSTQRERAERPHDRLSSCPSQPGEAEVLRFGHRYADLRDRRLTDRLILEDAAEEREDLAALERITCHFHRRWVHECIGSPVHVIIVTGHRWCRRCEAEALVAVDELTGSVAVTCTRCHRCPDTEATRQILRTCRASLAATRESHRVNAHHHEPAKAA